MSNLLHQNRADELVNLSIIFYNCKFLLAWALICVSKVVRYLFDKSIFLQLRLELASCLGGFWILYFMLSNRQKILRQSYPFAQHEGSRWLHSVVFQLEKPFFFWSNLSCVYIHALHTYEGPVTTIDSVGSFHKFGDGPNGVKTWVELVPVINFGVINRPNNQLRKASAFVEVRKSRTMIQLLRHLVRDTSPARPRTVAIQAKGCT